MIAILVVYLILVGYAVHIMRKVVRTSAGFAWIARTKGIAFGSMRDGGFVVTNFIPFTAQRRIRNGVAAVVWPVTMTTFFMLALYWLASLIASAV